MKIQRAIDIISNQSHPPHTFKEWQDAQKIAIDAMKKQVAKKPVHKLIDTGYALYINIYCASCNKLISDDGILMCTDELPMYCDNCGQRFDWSSFVNTEDYE